MAYSFGGSAIFGRAARSQTSAAERAKQVNEFFGLNGVEVLDGGARGGKTVVAGIIAGAGVAAYQTAWSVAASYQDNQPRTLVVADGSFPQVIMTSWLPAGEIQTSPGGIYYRRYRAEFQHLI
jgi:hypothetical protein